ncbi:gfo/Idh/MocA family oxidoreductase [candidate division KSB1 bacterium]|nr:gfo/Idh/MocA family oxidoreductase [candidate division KSB1 bacterium]
MSGISRRDFMKNSIGATVTAGSMSSIIKPLFSQVSGSNQTIHMAVVGFHSKGRQHIEKFHQHPNARVVALCDVDEEVLNREKEKFSKRNEPVKIYRDVRRLLDDKDIDAVAVATPDHWHVLMGIWTCQAGKHLYIEKPVSLFIDESHKLVQAAQKYNCIVQAGTQNRSDVGFRQAVDYIKSGNIGAIKWAQGIWYKDRDCLDTFSRPQPVPPYIDYNLWSGPAPLKPLTRSRVHYDWHWFWDYGTGEMGNLGVHQIDDCRFALGLQGYPRRIMSFGGRYAWNDCGETPNTHIALLDYDDFYLVIDLRNLPTATGVNSMDHFRGTRMGNVIQGEKGYFVGGRGGGWIYDNSGKKQKPFPGDGGGLHQANFIDALQNNDPGRMHAPLMQGHISSMCCHIANISYKLGDDIHISELQQALPADSAVQHAAERFGQHLQKNSVNADKNTVRLGPWLTFDDKSGCFNGAYAGRANALSGRELYRYPFCLPEEV